MIVRHKIAGIYVNPINPEKISIEVNHDQDAIINQARPHVGVSGLSLAREDIAFIKSKLNQPPGITEGIPYDIEITERGVTEVIQMYVDFMSGGLSASKDGLNIGIKMRQSLDALNDRIDAFTYESMYNETGVKPFTIDGITCSSYQDFFDRKCVYVPYVLSSIPDYQNAYMAIFSLVWIGVELARAIKELFKAAAPSVGLGVVMHVAAIIFEVAFTLGIFILLFDVLTQLISFLIQPLKYHGAMLMVDMLKITAAKLGLTFRSSIWENYPYNQIAYLPEKYEPLKSHSLVMTLFDSKADSGRKFDIMSFAGANSTGYTSPAKAPSSAHDSNTPGIQHGYLNGTGGDLLRLAKTFCNGKIIIPDQTNDLVLERRDYYPSGTPYQLPDIRQDWNEYNLDELIANILIRFATDLNEKNSVDNYLGTMMQATHQQILTINQALVGLKGIREIKIAASRGIAKRSLTWVENMVNQLIDFMNDNRDGLTFFINTQIIGVVNVTLKSLKVLAIIWNLTIDSMHVVTNVINAIIDVINAAFGASIDHITVFDHGNGKIDLKLFDDVPLFTPNQIPKRDALKNRLAAWLFENDMIDTPKLLMIDTSRSEFTNSRIGYAHTDNNNTVHALNLWNKFYFIDAFVNPSNVNDRCNRFVKISPALNKNSEHNPTTLSLRDFKNLVSNPKFLDNFGEEVIADSIQWYPEMNGKAEFEFRKHGWLIDPQNPNSIKRNTEININLQLKLSVPNGQ